MVCVGHHIGGRAVPRLFTAISLPESVRDQIGDLQQPMPGTRWVDDDNLHLTLRFAGDIDNPTADDLSRFLNDITSVPVFEMRLYGLGTFGGRDPRSLWAGVKAGPELLALARAHERAARNAGLAAEKRVFRPHVTIARLKYAHDDVLARFLSCHGGFQSDPFIVDRFTLFSAKPLTGGGPYLVEEEISLQGAPAYFDSEFDPDVA